MLEHELYDAVKGDNIEEVRRLLDLGAGIGLFNHEETVMTSVLIEFAHKTEILKLLLQRYPDTDVNVVSTFHYTPALTACLRGSLESLKLLHAHGANLFYCKPDGDSLLDDASHDLSILQFLLDQGVSKIEKGLDHLARGWHPNGEAEANLERLKLVLGIPVLPFQVKFKALIANFEEMSLPYFNKNQRIQDNEANEAYNALRKCRVEIRNSFTPNDLVLVVENTKALKNFGIFAGTRKDATYDQVLSIPPPRR